MIQAIHSENYSQISIQYITILQNINKSLKVLLSEQMRPIVAAIALTNGMVGSTILVIPILTLKTGTILSLIVTLITGFLSFYSCYLYVQHLGNHSDLDKAMYYHFWNSKAVKIFYDFIIFFNMLLVMIVYYLLIVDQWNGLISNKSIFNPIGNAIGLFALICLLKYARFGAHLLGYGLISIIMYCLFLIWIIASETDNGQKVPISGSGVSNFAATMAQAFSIQQIFIPVLKQLPISQTKNFVKYTLTAYVVGGLIYIYITFAGSIGIVNRTSYYLNPQTIQQYFPPGRWQVSVIQILYLIHLYSAYGQFCLITKKRFFGVLNTLFKTKNTRQNQFFSIPEIIFVFIIVGSGLAVQLGKITVQSVIQINGGIVGFFFIYLFPALLQFKCLYFARPKPVFQVVFRASADASDAQNVEMNERSSTVRTRPILFNKPPNEQISMHIATEQIRNRNGSTPDGLQKNIELSDKNMQKTEEEPSRKSKVSNISAFQLQTGMNRESLIAGADKQTVIMSMAGAQQKQSMEIQKLNEICPCKKPEGFYKVLDLTAIFGMIALGLFVMVYEMMNLTTVPPTPTPAPTPTPTPSTL